MAITNVQFECNGGECVNVTGPKMVLEGSTVVGR